MSKKEKTQIGGCGCVAIVLLLGFIYLMFTSRPNPDAPRSVSAPTAPVISVGNYVTVGPGHGAWLATTSDAYDELIDAQNANSGALVGRLIEAGKAFREPEGSRLLVVQTSTFSLFCRVVTGANVGREGWVQKGMVTLDR